MNNELPKAEDILKEVYKGDDSFVGVFSPYDFEKIYAAMHEYARRVLDVAAEECDKRIIPGHFVQAPSMIEAGKAILRLKELLK